MQRIPADAMREVEWAIQCYEEEVSAAGLSLSVEDAHIRYARRFVRWLKGEFTPGTTPPAQDAPR